MGKREIKMHFKKFYVKIFKNGLWKSGFHGNGLIGSGSNQHTIIFPR